jgi:hypothetical protein
MLFLRLKKLMTLLVNEEPVEVDCSGMPGAPVVGRNSNQEKDEDLIIISMFGLLKSIREKYLQKRSPLVS